MWSDGDIPDTSWAQKQRHEFAEEPIAHAEVRHTLSRAAQHDQLLLEQEILSDHGSHCARSTEPRSRDGKVSSRSFMRETA
jgi:hypothetical protein